MSASNECKAPLLEDENCDGTLNTVDTTRIKQSWRSIYTKISLAILTITLIVGVIVSIAIGDSLDPKSMLAHCGKSVTEARSLGCKFDIMEFGWVHPDCWDQELLDEYAPPERWVFGWDRELQDTITQAQASTGHINALWVRNDYHGAHCVYVFHKMAKALAEGKPVNRRMRQMVHTHHCSGSIHGINPANFNMTGLGGVNFMVCDSGYLSK